MLILEGNSVLLGRSAAWPEGMYSLLAGFMEPGELIEAAVRREVFEETAIPVGPGRLPLQPALAVPVQPDDRLPRHRPARDITWTPPSSRTPAGSAARTCSPPSRPQPRPPSGAQGLDRPLPHRALAGRQPRLKEPNMLALALLLATPASAQDVPEALTVLLFLRRWRRPRRSPTSTRRAGLLTPSFSTRAIVPMKAGPTGSGVRYVSIGEPRLVWHVKGDAGLPRLRRRRRNHAHQRLPRRGVSRRRMIAGCTRVAYGPGRSPFQVRRRGDSDAERAG